MSITVVGTVALDSIKTPFGDKKRILGGSALHFANAAHLLSKGKINLVAVVGNDFPREGIDFLHSIGVNTDGLEIDKNGKTFHWEGAYEKDMNSAITIATHLNVLETFKPKIPDNYINTNFLFLANIAPLLQQEVLERVEPKKGTILDTMNFWIDSAKDDLIRVIRNVDAIVLNDGETRSLTGIDNLVTAGKEILKLGPKYVILKKGEYGCSIFGQNGEYFAMPSYPTEEVKDPTGAGDSFAGGTISYLSQEGELSFSALTKAITYGTILASFYVEGFGVDGLNKKSLNDIKQRYGQFVDYATLPKIF